MIENNLVTGYRLSGHTDQVKSLILCQVLKSSQSVVNPLGFMLFKIKLLR